MLIKPSVVRLFLHLRQHQRRIDRNVSRLDEAGLLLDILRPEPLARTRHQRVEPQRVGMELDAAVEQVAEREPHRLGAVVLELRHLLLQLLRRLLLERQPLRQRLLLRCLRLLAAVEALPRLFDLVEENTGATLSPGYTIARLETMMPRKKRSKRRKRGGGSGGAGVEMARLRIVRSKGPGGTHQGTQCADREFIVSKKLSFSRVQRRLLHRLGFTVSRCHSTSSRTRRVV